MKHPLMLITGYCRLHVYKYVVCFKIACYTLSFSAKVKEENMFAGTPKILLSLTFHKHYKIDNVMYQSQFLFVEHFPQCQTLEIAFTYYSLGSSTLHTMQQDLP